ncbi:MAG: hypothetical protein ISN29_10020 [Gammaproteobacteria bacterium AqS3]|nr:hypothetical protein [Gammaproteobacteria bacterium AqS3]
MSPFKTPKLKGIEREYRRLPRVVKFSGGRSSGMMLIALLEQGLLKAERGDVVVFNNTSAEHPATYEFVRKCTELAERQYGIPFFWTEYASYEDCAQGIWKRQITYRLVNTQPYDAEKNPDGYRWGGEVFEEMVSQQGFLPNRHTRNCTTSLKLGVTTSFLSEWFAAKRETLRRGHHYPTSQIDFDDIFAMHLKSRGKFTREELQKRKAYSLERDLFRPVQKYSDFSRVGSAPMIRALGDKNPGMMTRQMRGEAAFRFVSIMGLRADEPRRVARVKDRNDLDFDDPERRSTGMCDGEVIWTPLADSDITKQKVRDFWAQHPKLDLKLPDEANLSNCVYCFMKGTNALKNIVGSRQKIDKKLPQRIKSVDQTPSDISWWISLENKYQRTAEKRYSGRGRPSTKKMVFGFWGGYEQKHGDAQSKAAVNYQTIYQGSEMFDPDGIDARPCDCTD